MSRVFFDVVGLPRFAMLFPHTQNTLGNTEGVHNGIRPTQMAVDEILGRGGEEGGG